jgi:hypothetical protein
MGIVHHPSSGVTAMHLTFLMSVTTGMSLEDESIITKLGQNLEYAIVRQNIVQELCELCSKYILIVHCVVRNTKLVFHSLSFTPSFYPAHQATAICRGV